ncbi:uroporphyrinogen-III synthase [Vagococcus intermedius]|uniref:Uroporphyrinogen-III synthase n=1 Tax=Vagococcus intermedius TaxID=2991418 RepID=A0AAF0CTT7_9ENTE|nr:uroporphyrinogen-III synthase [Vagococcus intermedius]WEG72724.1 uroporphyrinogen-III synthase [Vagococcus intermedius]
MVRELLFTRQQPLSSNMKRELLSLGFRISDIPLISLSLLPNLPKDLPRKITYDWIFLTSAAAVNFFYEAFDEIPMTAKLAVIGEKTYEALRKNDQQRAYYPDIFTSEYFVAEWLEQQITAQYVLFPQSRLSRQLVQTELRKAGHRIDAFTLYDNVFTENAREELTAWLNTRPSDATVIFCSPSAWHHFYDCYQTTNLPLKFASIGPITTKAIQSVDCEVTYEARECTMKALIKEIIKGN